MIKILSMIGRVCACFSLLFSVLAVFFSLSLILEHGMQEYILGAVFYAASIVASLFYLIGNLELSSFKKKGWNMVVYWAWFSLWSLFSSLTSFGGRRPWQPKNYESLPFVDKFFSVTSVQLLGFDGMSFLWMNNPLALTILIFAIGTYFYLLQPRVKEKFQIS